MSGPDQTTKWAIARTVHEAVRAWAHGHGQTDLPAWDAAPDWMKDSTMESIDFVLENPDADDGAQHDQWMDQKRRDGWSLGAEKNDIAKTHPMMVPFADLPDFEKRKDTLVRAIVAALT